MLIYSFITDYQAFSLRCKDNTTRDKNETKVGKQSANLGKNNEPIQNRLSFLIDCKSVILHHLTILSFPMVRPAWDNWWLLVVISEVFPNSVRSGGQVFGSMTHWIWSALLSWFFPVFLSIGATYIFGFFSMIALGSLVFAIKLPETKDKSLEEIQKELIL